MRWRLNGAAPSSLTGSAMPVARTSASDIQRVRQAWQDRAFGYYDLVPEIWFASQFYARGLSKVRLFPALRDENGVVTDAEDAELSELWDRVQDVGGGRSTMFSSYGRLMFLNGDCFLFCSAPNGEEMWEVISTRELTVNTEGLLERVPKDGGDKETYRPLPPDAESVGPSSAIAYRLWRRHPRKSQLSDAPLRACLDICEELVLLTLGIRARIRSRLSGAGILAIDADVTLPAAEDGDESDEDTFIRKLGEHLMEPIGDEGSASAVVPYLMRIPTAGRKIDDLISHIRVHMPNEDFPERGMREEAVKRLATGLDMPPELLLGLSGANHWTSWMIDEQSWELLQPTVQQLCDDFSSAYLRPAAREAGYADWEHVTLGYDEAEIVTSPDRTKDAAQAHDRMVISDKAYREVAGWEDEDGITDEDERQRRMAIKLRDASLLPAGERPSEAAEPGPPESRPEQPRTPSGRPERSNGRPPSESALVAGASEYAVERARELAGSRIRTRLKGCAPCQHSIDGFPNSLVASVLGPTTTAEAGSEEELVAGAGASLARLLMRRGVDGDTASRLGAMVESHAARTLYLAEPPPLELEEVK